MGDWKNQRNFSKQKLTISMQEKRSNRQLKEEVKEIITSLPKTLEIMKEQEHSILDAQDRESKLYKSIQLTSCSKQV